MIFRSWLTFELMKATDWSPKPQIQSPRSAQCRPSPHRPFLLSFHFLKPEVRLDFSRNELKLTDD